MRQTLEIVNIALQVDGMNGVLLATQIFDA
jgi:hypothetical protein